MMPFQWSTQPLFKCKFWFVTWDDWAPGKKHQRQLNLSNSLKCIFLLMKSTILSGVPYIWVHCPWKMICHECLTFLAPRRKNVSQMQETSLKICIFPTYSEMHLFFAVIIPEFDYYFIIILLGTKNLIIRVPCQYQSLNLEMMKKSDIMPKTQDLETVNFPPT